MSMCKPTDANINFTDMVDRATMNPWSNEQELESDIQAFRDHELRVKMRNMSRNQRRLFKKQLKKEGRL